MSLAELHNLLLTLEIPVAYDHFKDEQKPPFIAYRVLREDFKTADSKTAFRLAHLELSYCSDLRNIPFERQIEQLFESHLITFDKAFLYLDKQSMYQINYNFCMIGG